jgi:TonB-dependent receptor
MRVFLAFLLLFTGCQLFAQQLGTLSGKVFNNSNNAVNQVSVSINGVARSKSDIQGFYSIKLAPGKYLVTFSIVGYQTRNDSVTIAANKVTDLEVLLTPKKKNEDAVTVTTTKVAPRRETVNSGIAFLKNTSTVASIITAEAIKRSPDRNTGEVLKRTPGASIQEGKFLVVRGLPDRYNQAMLNGILLTSTEPDRKTFSFDLIPSNMIDNLVINKAFLPEYPGEWAGGLIQINTKDIPTANFLNVQLGTGFNTQTIGRDFLRDPANQQAWLGISDGSRDLPVGYIRKGLFDASSNTEKTLAGSQMANTWAPVVATPGLNSSVQLNGGFAGKLFGKKIGMNLGVSYNRSQRYIDLNNQVNTLAGNDFSLNSNFEDDKSQDEVNIGAFGSFTLQLNNDNKISLRSLLSLNTSSAALERAGFDVTRDQDLIGGEFNFRQNTFSSTQLSGDHAITKGVKLKWYGSFNILDSYSPDQRRILYGRQIATSDPYKLQISNTTSQESGSRIYQFLNDYIYTTGGDVTFTLKSKQTIKAGYMFQVRDRLYDAKLFAVTLPGTNEALKLLPRDQVFQRQNFGDGFGTLFGFDAIKGNTFRYLANTILNAGYIQADNQLFNDKLRLVYGLRFERFDQLIGSVKTWDPRHSYSVVNDFLPGLNATWKINPKTNLRLSGSQTVVRPEFRELAALNLFDFELNASIQGNPNLKRTKVTNVDLRYEYYGRPGEIFSVGAFYKDFRNAIEQQFTLAGGGASSFNMINAQKAYSTGMELEFRKKLDFTKALKNFTFLTNLALIQSKVTDARFGLDRPLQGQSPYIINVSLNYDLAKHGFTATLLYNRIGERIFLVGEDGLVAGGGFPNIWEAPRDLIDLQFTKKVLKTKGELKLNISDLLNQVQYFYQNKPDSKESLQRGQDAFRFTRRFGTNIGLSFIYAIK